LREEIVMTAGSRVPRTAPQSSARPTMQPIESSKIEEFRPSRLRSSSTTARTTLDKTIYTRVGTEDKEEDRTASRQAEKLRFRMRRWSTSTTTSSTIGSSSKAADTRRNPSRR